MPHNDKPTTEPLQWTPPPPPPRGCDCCDPTSPSPDPVVVRLEAEVAELSGKSGELERERDALQAAVEQLKSTPEHYLRGCVNVLASKLAEYTGKTVPTEITGAESVVDENEELRAEVERLDTAWRAIDRANESLREQLGTLRGLLREAVEAADYRDSDDEWWGNMIDDSWFVRVVAALEGKP